MPTLQPKPKRSTGWLPTQVAYGVDCSDENPAKWKAFGYNAPSETRKPASGTTEQTIKS